MSTHERDLFTVLVFRIESVCVIISLSHPLFVMFCLIKSLHVCLLLFLYISTSSESLSLLPPSLYFLRVSLLPLSLLPLSLYL